ncbi:ribosomal protein L30 [Anaeramoeba flamelloides]|uniref:Ribosomal protein L30 n=1 Tax=Anaeramoeba flamelloides TaxID=1746091 RepID=A0ABQ8Y296_9EUKA|nr:ribosomal protein L30 [Anaeramoeba flamelloides]
MSKKSKKNEGIGSKLALVIKSGKYHLGTQQCLKDLRKGEGKLLIVANNCPPLKKSEIQYYAMLSRCKFHQFNGNNIDLGRACERNNFVYQVKIVHVDKKSPSFHKLRKYQAIFVYLSNKPLHRSNQLGNKLVRYVEEDGGLVMCEYRELCESLSENRSAIR